MEDTFVWMLVFAGATIGLLATFLISSERELKKKRREIDQLLTKIEEAAVPISADGREHSPNPAQPNEREQQLADEISALSAKLRASEAGLEEIKLTQERLSAAELEKTELRVANDQLQRETADLKVQLESSRACIASSETEHNNSADHRAQLLEEIAQLKDRLEQSQFEVQCLVNAQEQQLKGKDELLGTGEAEKAELRLLNEHLQRETADLKLQLDHSRTHDAATEAERNNFAERCAQLAEEIAQLKDQLEQSQSEVQRLANAHEQLGDARARELVASEQQRRLERERTGLESELSAARDELSVARSRIEESETRQEQLRHESQRLQEELSACRERLGEIDRGQVCLDSARQQLDELRVKHAACFDAHRSFETALSGLGLLLESPTRNGTGTIPSTDTEASLRLENGTATLADHIDATGAHTDSLRLDSIAGNHSSNMPAAQPSAAKRRRFGIFTS